MTAILLSRPGEPRRPRRRPIPSARRARSVAEQVELFAAVERVVNHQREDAAKPGRRGATPAAVSILPALFQPKVKS